MSNHAMPDRSVRVEASIPVLPMLDEERTRAYYVDFLGFEVEWEHRFREGTPLYAQIRLGDARIHLNGHAEEGGPVAEVRIPVHGIEAFCEELAARRGSHPEPHLEDPRGSGEGTDLPLRDPAGNLLIFWKAPVDES